MIPLDTTAVLAALGRTTLALGAAAVVVQLMLWLARPQSARVHRAAWICVLLVGWLWLRVPVAIPYDAPVSPVMEATSQVDERETERGGGVPPSVRVEKNESFAPQALREAPAPAGQGPVGPQSGQALALPVVAWSWPAILLGLWVAGLVTLVFAWLAGYAWFAWRLPAALDGLEEWHEQWRQLLDEQGLRRPIPLHLTTRIGPMLCRLPGGYRLVVPLALWQRLSPGGRLSVLRHELAHLQRGDVWKSLLMRLAALPHWFNPAAWWALRRLDEAAEWDCDAAARGESPGATAEYARSLLALDELAGRHALYRPAAWGRGLSQRIRRLVAGQPVEDTIMKKLVVIVVALGLVAVFAVRFYPVANVRAEGDKTSSISGEVAVAAPATRHPAARESLRYDGKSFEQWYKELKTELKTERRTEAIRAFTEFGRRGYGKEATQAILEVMRDYSVRLIDTGPTGRLKQTALAAFCGPSEDSPEMVIDEPIDPEQSVPILINELKEGNENTRYFALYALASMGPNAKAAIPALMALWNSKPVDETTGLAIQGIVKADETGRHIVALLRESLAKHDVPRFTIVANALTSGGLMTLIEYDQQGFGGMGFAVLPPNSYRLTDKGRSVLGGLVEGVGDKQAEIRHAAINALGQIGPAARPALPVLISAFAKGDAEDRKAVAKALAGWPEQFLEDAVWIPLLTRTHDFREQAASAVLALRMKPSFARAIPKETLATEEFRRAYEEFRKEESQWRSIGSDVGATPLPSVAELRAAVKPPPPVNGMPGMAPTPEADGKESPKSETPKSP